MVKLYSAFSRVLPIKLVIRVFCLLVISFWTTTGSAQTTSLITPPASDSFGAHISVLYNGNIVVTDPSWDSGSIKNVGAVYLYDGATLKLISTLRGSKENDRVGIGGIVRLNSGNFLVFSPDWNVSTLNGRRAGAVTWVNGATGLADTISEQNSLVGSFDDERIGFYFGPLITHLNTGNFLISTPNWTSPGVHRCGAVTFGNGNFGFHGRITTINSLVGFSRHWSGFTKVVPLTNGNYVVWGNFDDSARINCGSVTWGDGTYGTFGIVDSTNSVTGSRRGDIVGPIIVALANGNYVVGSPHWFEGSYRGAATWMDGTKPTTGLVLRSNSMVAGLSNETEISVTALSNGNYVISFPWGENDKGTVTWAYGRATSTGIIGPSNSLMGTTNKEMLSSSVIALSNGNYAVHVPNWNSGRGAVTWCNGTQPTAAKVGAGNSLVGATPGDSIGSGGIFNLPFGGNYVISSPRWDRGTVVDAGAATWVNGNLGISGPVNSGNSLVGTRAGDAVSDGGIANLGGNFVVASPHWDNGTIIDAGAATWGDGTVGLTDTISINNSLIGGSDSDQVSIAGIQPLGNWNYVVASPNWHNAAGRVGAATWAVWYGGIKGLIDSTNSLTGSKDGDAIANRIIPLLYSGDFLVESEAWQDTSRMGSCGALTYGNGLTGLRGSIDSINSLVGISLCSNRKSTIGVESLLDGNYLVKNQFYHSGPITGGCTSIGNGNIGRQDFRYSELTGTPNSCNSLFGSTGNFDGNMVSDFDYPHNRLIVGFPSENRVSILDLSTQELAVHNDSARHGITAKALSPVTFECLSDCRLVTSMMPAGTNPIHADVTAVAFVEPTMPYYLDIPYVRRHYDISSETTSGQATNRITLYFNQSDFDNFNNNNGGNPDLPSNPNDQFRVAQLRIIQEHGRSSTGLLGSYSGTGAAKWTVINPPDSSIFWNSYFHRWEITVDVTGLGGFFAYAEGSTSVKKISTAQVAVSPNPATSELYIAVSDETLSGQTAWVSDIQGRKMLQFTLEKKTKLDVRSWPSGIYCLHLPNAETLKIVKQ